jgi:hypothetical protein
MYSNSDYNGDGVCLHLAPFTILHRSVIVLDVLINSGYPLYPSLIMETDDLWSIGLLFQIDAANYPKTFYHFQNFLPLYKF